MTPIVLHIPHASAVIPDEERGAFTVSDAELTREVLLMTDHHTDALFQGALPGFHAEAFPVSRLVVDPERFPDDANEPMAAKGMGAVYTTRQDGAPLRRPPSADERRRLLETYYHPHHAALERAVGDRLRTEGRCLVLDCHSFPSKPLPYEDAALRRPEICIGTDGFHTPPPLIESALDAFDAAGFDVARDEPFAGALVPTAFYRRDARVAALMVEVRRDLYMDEATGAMKGPPSGFADALSAFINQIL